MIADVQGTLARLLRGILVSAGASDPTVVAVLDRKAPHL